MPGRRTRRPSWLSLVRAASVAFTGQSRLLEETWVPASETSFRGAGYRLTAEITPLAALFGPLPGKALRLQGESRRASDQRLSYEDARFPPDSLRNESYWEYSRPDEDQPVLVMLTQPATVRLLSGPDDDLPRAVTFIHRWANLNETDQPAAVLNDLRKPSHSPVAYVAGFDLLQSVADDLPGLVDVFLTLPDRPGTAVQGILDILYRRAISMTQPELTALARHLLSAWARETEAPALMGFLTWFDAYQWAWRDEPQLKAEVVAQAERARALSFPGPYGPAWSGRVRQQAELLLSVAE